MVTPSGDIEMQTFSVTKKVYIFIQFYPFSSFGCSSIMCINVFQTFIVLLHLLFLQRDSSDNMEASIVLSGMFM